MKKTIHILLNVIVWCFFFLTRNLFTMSLHQRMLYPEEPVLVLRMIIFWGMAVVFGVLIGFLMLQSCITFCKGDYFFVCVLLAVNIIYHFWIRFGFGELYIFPMILIGMYAVYAIGGIPVIKRSDKN